MPITRAAMVVLAAGLAGCTAGMKHTRIRSTAPVARGSINVDKIGHITSMVPAGEVMYVAGEQGLAALKPDGSALWTLELPKVDMRSIAVAGERIAFSNYSVKQRVITSSFSGPGYRDCAVGVATTQGALMWSTPCEEGEGASAPAVGADRVAVSHGKYFSLYELETGRRVARTKIGFAVPVLTVGLMSQASHNRPVFLDGAFFDGHLTKFLKFAPDGRIENETKGGFRFEFGNVTAGPVLVRDLVVFAGVPFDCQDKPLLYAADRYGERVWAQAVPAQQSGVGEMAVHGDRIYLATNEGVLAYDAAGKELWRQSGGPALSLSSLRGLRNAGGGVTRACDTANALAKTTPSSMMARIWNGALLDASADRVYLASQVQGRDDAVTVLDASTGAYVETIDLRGAQVFDLALWGDRLAISTDRGLALFAEK